MNTGVFDVLVSMNEGLRPNNLRTLSVYFGNIVRELQERCPRLARIIRYFSFQLRI